MSLSAPLYPTAPTYLPTVRVRVEHGSGYGFTDSIPDTPEVRADLAWRAAFFGYTVAFDDQPTRKHVRPIPAFFPVQVAALIVSVVVLIVVLTSPGI